MTFFLFGLGLFPDVTSALGFLHWIEFGWSRQASRATGPGPGIQPIAS